MILVCSRGHVIDTKNIGHTVAYGQKIPGDRCPVVMTYSIMSGTTYCRRILREVEESDDDNAGGLRQAGT